jgi:2-keto-4-pentenoate hydratase/2-oxohepta-3-ene-1,7-dioic acid hydratase in catechol pathway
MTLLPGDVIATGTPAGVGRPKGTFLKPGDVVRIEISDIGVLENRVEQGE